jgi:hypothetical protein
MADCSYSRLAWQQLAAWLGDANAQLRQSANRQVKAWWTQIMQADKPGLRTCGRKGAEDYGTKATTDGQLQSIIRLDVAQFNNAWSSSLYIDHTSSHT